MSTMALIAKGRSTAPKTRHIRLRYFWLKDRVDSGDIVIKHMPADKMLVDVLTKPLQGENFYRMRDALLRYNKKPSKSICAISSPANYDPSLVHCVALAGVCWLIVVLGNLV